jgi:O-antigen ligase
LEIAAPLALGYSFYGMTRLKQAHTPGFTLKDLAILGHQGMFKIVLPLIAFVLLSGILFATFSRGAILAYLVSMMLFFIMMRKRRSLRSMSALLVVVMVIVLMVGLVAAWERIEDRFSALRYEERLSRAWVWADLVPLIRDFPIFGTGLGTFDRAFLRYQTKYSTNTFEHAENEYLEVLTDTGFAGFLLFSTAGTAFCVMLISMWKNRRSAFAVCMGAGGLTSFAAMAAHGMTDFNLRVPANALLMTVVLGLTFAALRPPDDGDRDRDRTCSNADDRSRRTGDV